MPFDQRTLAVLSDHLPKERILDCYAGARGKELESGKFHHPDSSSALVANTFGCFLTEPASLQLPEVTGVCGTTRSVVLEKELRFPWRGGLHPWLDVVAETDTHLIGIESKRFEPFREKKTLFSEAFKRPVWGDNMKAFERLRDDLSQGFLHLDPVQLTKHALAIRTQAKKSGKIGLLVYLYAEPSAFSKGPRILAEAKDRHRSEVRRFAEAVQGAEVTFYSMTYRNLLDSWMASNQAFLRDHARYVAERYDID